MKRHLKIYALIFSLMALCASCALAEQKRELVKTEHVQRDEVNTCTSDSSQTLPKNVVVNYTYDCYFVKSETVVLFGCYWLKVKEVKPYTFTRVVNYVMKLKRGNNSPPKNYI